VTLGRGALREERDAPNNWQLMSDALPAMEMTEVPAGSVVRASGVAARSVRQWRDSRLAFTPK